MTGLGATTRTVALSVENARLRTELYARLDELKGCRRRLIGAIDAERRRIERDLHDATQGRLVSLAMLLGYLETKLPGDPSAARPIAREAREAVADALHELRELTNGTYPSVLAERGLRAALEELCGPAPLPVTIEVSLDRRLPADVEAAAYFAASEALTNVLKHADARHVRIAITDEQQQLVVEVADRGIGGASIAQGSGLRGLIDRVQSLGGEVTVSSPVGHGTTVHAEIPC